MATCNRKLENVVPQSFRMFEEVLHLYISGGTVSVFVAIDAITTIVKGEIPTVVSSGSETSIPQIRVQGTKEKNTQRLKILQ